MSLTNSRAEAMWQSGWRMLWGSSSFQGDLFKCWARWAPPSGATKSRNTSIWHVTLAVPAPPEGKVSRMQAASLLWANGCFLKAGTWYVVQQWLCYSSKFIWLQQVLPEWLQSVLGERRCFPLEELPFPPTHEAACVEWAVSNRAWDKSGFPDIIHNLPSSHSNWVDMTAPIYSHWELYISPNSFY